MSSEQISKDLVVLVADKDMDYAVRGLLDRYRAFNLSQPITSDIFVHPQRDPGCLLRGHDFLRPFINNYLFGLILLDKDGCGQEHKTRQELEVQIEQYLSNSGWGDRAAAIVIDPELEIWVWSDSPHVETILEWHGRDPNLRTWLKEREFLIGNQPKPNKPKEAMEEALRVVRKPRSSSIYLELAKKVSFSNCSDEAFLKFKQLLTTWFTQR